MSGVDILSWAFLGAGSFLCVSGALGLLRLPDFYARLHAGGVIDTGGASLVLVGLMLQAGFSLIAVKLLFILAFLLITSPTATHAIAHAAGSRGLEPLLHEKEGDTSTSSST